eukprot:COSAG02_NODE_70595_length_194_cov_1390.726316_1_plen_56_part_10
MGKVSDRARHTIGFSAKATLGKHPPSFNAQMPGIQPGENYGQLFVKRTKVKISYTP